MFFLLILKGRIHMKHMNKKRLISVFLTVAMVGSLAACSSNSAGNSTPAASGISSSSTGKIKLVAPQVGINATQLATAKKNAETAGTDLAPGDQYHIAVTNSIAKDYPNYDMDYVDWGWGEQLDQKQMTLLASGQAPDIVAGETFIPTYASQGILSPLPQDIVDSVNPSFLVYDSDKKPVAVSYKSSVFMLFYNKDLMKKAGLDPNSPPKTWDELKQMSDAVTKAGNGKFWGGGIPTFTQAGGALRVTPFIRMMGTDFGKDGKINLADPNLQKALQYIREMNANFPKGLGNSSDEGPMWDAFEKKHTIAFAINGGWESSGAASLGDNLGVATLPIPAGGQDGNCMVGSTYLAVPKAAKNQEASFNLIRECLKQDNLNWLIKEGDIVALKSMISDSSLYKDNQALTVAMNAVKKSSYSGLYSFPLNNNEIWTSIEQDVLGRTTMTNDPISTICSEAQTKIQGMQ